MKNLRNTLILAVSVAVPTLLFLSCSQETLKPDQPVISAEVLTQLENLGFDVSDVELVSNTNPITGESSGHDYLVEGDIRIAADQLKAMSASDISHVGAVGEQYRTFNLVSAPRTIRVLGYTGGSNALTSRMRTGLQWAVNNYNRINTSLNFTLSFGTNHPAFDIVVYRVASSGGGGSAGFPSNGAPYKWVQINSGTNNFSTNVNEHVITHEIGHCLGMRHTDYFNRSLSCGSGGNEGSGGVGAVHISGTPTGFDPNSIMLSCFSSSEDGEFGSFDVTALEFLY